jgi:hypothetical protein
MYVISFMNIWKCFFLRKNKNKNGAVLIMKLDPWPRIFFAVLDVIISCVSNSFGVTLGLKLQSVLGYGLIAWFKLKRRMARLQLRLYGVRMWQFFQSSMCKT